MTKKLLVQTKNKWRNNLRLALELLVVSVVMQFVVDYLYAGVATYSEPRGFDISHCYLTEMGKPTEKSPDYLSGQTGEQKDADILELMDRLRRRPEIEVASLLQNSYPYNGNNPTDQVRYDTLVADNWTTCRMVTPDFVRVFRYQGARGETSEQLVEMLERGEFLVSNNLYRKCNRSMIELVGKQFQFFGDITQTFRLGVALKDIRYSDLQQTHNSYIFLYKLGRYDPGLELCSRVRADQDHDFIRRLKEDSEKQLRVDNIFISEIRSFKDTRCNYQQVWSNDLRNCATGTGFLLLNVFLGLFGTFWFRTQQCRLEIALYKACGASDINVFIRLASEGLLLLLLVIPIAFIIDYNLANMELNLWRNGTTLEQGRLLFCTAISFVLVGSTIAIGISTPARKAMKVQPAEALYGE